MPTPDSKEAYHQHIEDANPVDSTKHLPLYKRKWLLVSAVVFTVVAAIIIAIAVPISIRNHSTLQPKDESIHFASISKNKSDGGTRATTTPETVPQTNTTTRSIPSLITPDKQESFHPPFYAHAVSPWSNLTRLKIYYPSTQGRIFVMGDIHGCLNEMNQLLDKIQFKPGQDVLILAGDLVFRGQDSIGVIQRARELNALCVRGNHDDKVVRLKTYEYQHGVSSMSSEGEIMPEGQVGDPLKFGNKHIEISKNLNVEDYTYLAGCPLILDIPDLNTRVVHGGLDPLVSNLVDNDPWSVMNMRDMDDNNQPSKLKLNKKPDNNVQHWTTAYEANAAKTNNRVTVYYGHDASRGIVITNQTIGVDSGCVYGRKLSAVEMRSRQLTQVDCLGGDKHGGDDD
ncbi:Metallo-dependent phosphatase-like protein [Parasitella parasitica]|nr:Metallo-dependent phosphatase-like protein [Parasitella parasitica]